MRPQSPKEVGITAHGPETTASSSSPPPLHGRVVHCATAAPTWAWEVPGPSGAPDVLLVHGWMATSALNWYGSLGPLGQSFHTVAPNLRGHGRLGRGAPRFNIEASADDLAELIVALIASSSVGSCCAQPPRRLQDASSSGRWYAWSAGSRLALRGGTPAQQKAFSSGR